MILTLWYLIPQSLFPQLFSNTHRHLFCSFTHNPSPKSSHLKTRMFPKHSKFFKPQENIGGAHNLQKKLCSLCDHEAGEPAFVSTKKEPSDGRVQTYAARFDSLTASRKESRQTQTHLQLLPTSGEHRFKVNKTTAAPTASPCGTAS